MHLAYLDDSGTKDKQSPIQVMAGVIIEGWEFRTVELGMGALIESLVPAEKREGFEEFHAWELFGGYGPFDGVPQDQRLGVVQQFLRIVTQHKVPILFGACDVDALRDKIYASADPLDICFRACVQGIDLWAGSTIKFPIPSVDLQEAHPLVVLIADDFQGQIKATLRKSFRIIRTKVRPPNYSAGKTWHLHDELLFGNSKDSVGIQFADMCGHIIRRHLQGDASVTGFYDIIEEHIVFGQKEPHDEKEKAKAATANPGENGVNNA